METLLLGPGDVGLCADILKRGGVAAVPTETVYGLAANGLSPEAVRRIFAAKGRPEAKPISLFVTSANLSGEPAAVSGAEALSIFRGRVDAVLDGGVCPGGVPSTVVDLTGDIAKIVRLGALSKEAIEKTLGAVVK